MRTAHLISLLLCALPSCSPSHESLAPAAPPLATPPPLVCKPPPPAAKLQPAQPGLAGSSSGSPGTPSTAGVQAASTPPAVATKCLIPPIIARPKRRPAKPKHQKMIDPMPTKGAPSSTVAKVLEVGAVSAGKFGGGGAAKPKLEFFLGGTMSLSEQDLRGVIEEQFGPLIGKPAPNLPPSPSPSATRAWTQSCLQFQPIDARLI